MPSIKDQSTVEAIARGFIENKRNKYKGLLAAGYSDGYALTCGQKLYDNIRVIEAIKAIDEANNAMIAEDLRWEREDNLKHQYKQLDRYEAILEKQPDNPQALAGIDRVLRELNASSGQHSSTVNTNNKTLGINIAKRPELVKDVG